MSDLVKLTTRPSRDGKSFVYRLEYVDEDGRRRRVSLGHSDKRKAERQRTQTERELRMGVTAPEAMKLSVFLENCIDRTRGQVREGTLTQYDVAMRHFIEATGDIDLLKVEHSHGEQFIQHRLDAGDSPATANKKVRGLKRLFQLAVDRGQLETHPFRRIRRLKVPQKEIRVYSADECSRMLRAARGVAQESHVCWDLMISVALCTAMRRGEILNATWRDVDFDGRAITVSPKKGTDSTWEWNIKDVDRRRLPLTEKVINLLAEHQVNQPSGYPYVLVPRWRYDRIQELRQQGRWTTEHGLCPLNNFTRQFQRIQKRAGVADGEFHDLRCTCLTQWLMNGLSEYEVMYLAGHADFSTTHRFYLAVRRDVVDRARRFSMPVIASDSGTRLARAPISGPNKKRPSSISAGQPKT